MDIKEKALKIYHEKKSHVSDKNFKNKYPEEYSFLMEYTEYLPKNCVISQRLYHIVNELSMIPKCPECGKDIKFYRFTTGYMKFCSAKCAKSSDITIKRMKQTCLERYGTENYSSTDECKNRIKQTCLDKYGVDHNFKVPEIRDKIKQTCLERYGVDHQCKAKIVQDKIKQTCLERYGTENPTQNKTIKNKIKNTNIERYGSPCSFSNEEVQKKWRETCLEKYGVDHNFKSEDSKNKRKNTWIENYGVDQYWKSDKSIKDRKRHNLKHRKEVIWPRLIKSLEEKSFTLLTAPEEFTGDIEFLCDYGHKNSTYIGNWFRDLKCGKCSGGGTSKIEQDIFNYVSNFVEAENGTRKIISPKQLDIYIKEYNLAIEFNGIYYHSENMGTSIFYHLDKTLACKDKGITLIHIFEDEWNKKQDIVKSMLLNKLGKIENKIYARKCIIKEIETKIKNKFLEENHIQGTCASSINLGLFYKEELVSVMTFGKRNITGGEPKNELLRFCNKLNISIVGGASRLFKYYTQNYNPRELVSYADKRWFSGKMYEALGFKLDHESGPNYWYIVNGTREHRAKYQKHKLSRLLENFDSNKTEWQNMQDHGYDRIWDCGNLVYKWENK